MRYAQAVDTNKHTVITINKAMRRAGFLREREAAKHWGALRKRTPRSAWAWPVELANSSVGGKRVSSSS